MNKKILILIIIAFAVIVPIFSVHGQVTCNQLAAAMDADAADGLTSCSLSGDSRAAGILGGVNSNELPIEGANFAVLSSGMVTSIPGVPGGFASTDFGTLGTPAGDLVRLTLNFTVPAGYNCLSFDFEFFSEEYPDFVGSSYNDYFKAYLNGTNISFDGASNEISINNNYFYGLLPPNIFNGATPKLITTAPVTEGSNITMVFAVADEGDGIYDSAVFIDRFRIRFRRPGFCLASTIDCTDTDDDGFYTEGGVCGAVDCNDNDWCVNPGAFEEKRPGFCDPDEYNAYISHGCDIQELAYSCGNLCIYSCNDGKDNDCDGKIDLEEDGCPQFIPGGLVPCGRNFDDPGTEPWENCPCRLCHFLVLGKNIIDFSLKNLVIPLAVLLIVIGGVVLLTSSGSPEKMGRGLAILKTTVIAVVIIFGSWIIVNSVLTFLGIAQWTGIVDNPATPQVEGWWIIDCPIPDVCNDTNNTCKLPGEP